MRKLKLLLTLCLVAIAANASKTVYLIPGAWDDSGATERYALYMFDNGAGTNAWVSFTEGADGTWSAVFDETYPNMIICRMNGAEAENKWDNRWSQTEDLAAPFADGLTYTISGRDDNTPANNTYYISAYLYNPTTGLFLSRGACYGTAAWADNFGIPVIFIENEGGYRLQMIDQTDQYVSDAYWSYVDGGTDRAQTYTVSAVTGGYKFVNKAHSDGRTLYINSGAAQSGFSYQIASNGGSDNVTEGWDVWQLKTSSQRQAILASRTSEAESAIATAHSYTLTGTLKDLVEDANTFAATDKTNSITNAALVGDYTTGWTYTKVGNGGGATTNNNDGVEVYQGCGTFSQTVSGLTNGIYKVTLGGFFRDGWNDRCSELSNNGWRLGNAYLEANGNKVMLADWASDRSDNGTPNGTGAAKALINEGKYLNEVFANVTDGTLTINIAQPGGATGGRWLFISNATLTYYSDKVSDTEADAIIAQAVTLETTPLLAATKAALTNAKNTFSGAKTIANYNALGQAIAAAQASADIYSALGAALENANNVKTTCAANGATYVTTFDANIAAINDDYTNGAIAEADIPAKVKDVEAEVVLLVKSQTAAGSDMTLAVPNAAANAAAGDDNWKIENALASGEFFRLDTWAGTASGMSVPMVEYWITNGNTLSDNVIYQTISGLQEGVYTVTATTAVNNESNVAPNAGSALLFANNATTDITSGATETSFKGQTGTFTVQVVLTAADGGNLKIGFKTVSPNYNWIAFKNVKLTFDGATASDAEKQAFTTAYNAVKDNVFGFETDEYAPYNNVDAVKAFALAQAIKVATAAKEEIVAATNALNAATWTKNTAELNAVYDGTFAAATNDGAPLGWTMSNNTLGGAYHSRAFVGDARLSEFNTTNSGLFLRFDGTNSNRGSQYYYGNTEGYTMPLKANTSYIVMIDFTNWGTTDSKPLRLNVDGPNSFNVNQELSSTKSADTGTDAPDQFNVVFTTGDAGNYVLRFQVPGNDDNKHNVLISNVVLRKAVPVYAVVGSNEAEDDKVFFSGIWDAANTTDIMTENSGIWTKSFTDVELTASKIVYKVIKKGDIESKTAEYYPSGTGNNKEIEIKDNAKYDITFTFDPATNTVDHSMAVQKAISDAGYATYYSSYDLNFEGTGVKAYIAKLNGSEVTFEEVKNAPAETGLLLEAAEGTYKLKMEVSSNTYADNKFEGVLAQTTVNQKGIFVLMKGAKGAGFYRTTSDSFTLSANSAYLPALPGLSSRDFIGFDEETTGIEAISSKTMNGEVYNLQGQRVNKAQKGLYIVNGKKVVLK